MCARLRVCVYARVRVCACVHVCARVCVRVCVRVLVSLLHTSGLDRTDCIAVRSGGANVKVAPPPPLPIQIE